jgi:protein transport protein SEC23
MKEAVQLSGGMSVQTDTFTNVIFKDSLKRVFAKEGEEGFLGMASNATFEVRANRQLFPTAAEAPGWLAGRLAGWPAG